MVTDDFEPRFAGTYEVTDDIAELYDSVIRFYALNGRLLDSRHPDFDIPRGDPSRP